MFSINIFSLRNAFISASPDNIKQWKLPNGVFLQNLSGHKALVNALAVNMDGVVVSGGKTDSVLASCSYFILTKINNRSEGGAQLPTRCSFFRRYFITLR